MAECGNHGIIAKVVFKWKKEKKTKQIKLDQTCQFTVLRLFYKIPPLTQ